MAAEYVTLRDGSRPASQLLPPGGKTRLILQAPGSNARGFFVGKEDLWQQN